MKRSAWFYLAVFAFSVIAHANHPSWKPDYPAGKMPPRSDSDHVWLHIDGNYIKRSPTSTKPNEIWQGCGATPTTYMVNNPDLQDWIAGHEGINWMRISWFPWRGHTADLCPDEWTTFEQVFDEFIKPVVAKNKENKLYSLICSHIGTPTEYDTNVTPNFNQAEVDEWIDWWKQTATYYKDEPWVMGYEILNECSNMMMQNSVLRGWIRDCIRAIREIDTNHIIVVPGVLSGCIWGTQILWETDGISYQWEADLPDDKLYDFGDDYNQTAVRFHSYLTILNPNSANPDYPPAVYESTRWCKNTNVLIDYYQKNYNLCVINSEMGYWLGPLEWRAGEGSSRGGVTQVKYWNWVRWYIMQLIEIMQGEKDYWKDGPKANYYTGIVGTESPDYRENKIEWTTCMGDSFLVSPEPYPTCDTCVPHGRNIAWSYHGAPWRQTTVDSWQYWHRWEDIWGWAAKKSASPPPERSTNAIATTRKRIAREEIVYNRGVVTIGTDFAGSSGRLYLYGADGRLICTAHTSGRRFVELPNHTAGVGLLVVRCGNAFHEQRIMMGLAKN